VELAPSLFTATHISMMTDGSVEILLVEDNPDDVELTLQTFEDFNITNRIQVVRDGAEALDFVFRRRQYADRDPWDRPKVILLDIKLPLVDGLEVLRQIKADPVTRTIPVVLLTSSEDERDIAEGYRVGANSYITKPVAFEQFADAVRSLGMYWLLINRPPVAGAA
jgi:two-component system, response regulator